MRVLVTAFGPFGGWESNSSWLCLQHLTRELPMEPQLTTRLYPVDFVEARNRLAEDLKGGHDVAIHLGQAAGISHIHLEAIAVNAAEGFPGRETDVLDPTGPAAFRTSLPVARWARLLSQQGVPARVSYHAGTYLCNGLFYWSQQISTQLNLGMPSVFLHLPLDVSQVLTSGDSRTPWMPSEVAVRALRMLLDDLMLHPPGVV